VLVRLGRLKHDERGSVLTLFAVGIPTFILLLALALDIGNWYVHKERLQTRADDGSFAAALAYGYRFPDCTTDTSLSDEIAFIARQYAGDDDSSIPATFQPPFNASIDDTATTDVRINAFNPGADHYSDGPGNTGDPCFFHPDTNDFFSPDGGYWTDIKAREVNVASLFGGFGVPVPAITTAARLGLSKIATATAVQPFAVADAANTECAWARFGSTTFQYRSLAPSGNNTWTATQNVTMPSGGGSSLPVAVILGRRVSGSCPATPGDPSIVYPNVGYVDAFTNGGNPRVEGVALSGAPCNGYYVYRESGTCNISITATVVTPDCPPAQQPRHVYAWVGVPSSVTELTNTSGFSWTGALPTFTPGDGVRPIGIAVSCGGGARTDLGQVQSVMAGDDQQEGPIRNFTLSTTSLNNNGGAGSGPTTFSETMTLVLDPLHSDEAGDIGVVIRGESADTAGSQPLSGFLSGGVQCLSGVFANGTAVQNAVEAGCPDTYTPGTSTVTTMTNGGSGSGALQTAYNALWCSRPNNWGSYPDIPRGDPRLIVVNVTTPGAPFSRGAGDPGKTNPLIRLAAFYVTGWAGASCGSSDPGNDAAPVATAAGAGRIWGHFIKFVRPPSTGTPAASPCTWIEDGPNPPGTRNDVEACIATLVR
jgi:hypothetical protein